MNLSNLNAGDRVVVRVPVSTADWREYIDTVQRTTQTMIVLSDSGTRWWRQSGLEVGSSRDQYGRQPHIVPEGTPWNGDATDERSMQQMRQDVQAAAAVFEAAPSITNYEKLEVLVARWRDVAYLPTRI